MMYFYNMGVSLRVGLCAHTPACLTLLAGIRYYPLRNCLYCGYRIKEVVVFGCCIKIGTS